MPPNEDGSGWLGSLDGISGNNVISDRVSCNLDRNFQWLAGMRDKADIIQREIFRRQHEGILPNGSGFCMGVVNAAGQFVGSLVRTILTRSQPTSRLTVCPRAH